MPGKKRTTSAKQSSISKRHKAQPKPKKKYTGPKSAPDANGDGAAAEAAPARKSAFPADKARTESAKKDRKGKGPAYIETVEAQSDDESGGEDGGMEVDSELEGIDEQAAFLTKLDTKGMAA
jgi:nucleolar complex protein 3